MIPCECPAIERPYAAKILAELGHDANAPTRVWRRTQEQRRRLTAHERERRWQKKGYAKAPPINTGVGRPGHPLLWGRVRYECAKQLAEATGYSKTRVRAAVRAGTFLGKSLRPAAKG